MLVVVVATQRRTGKLTADKVNREHVTVVSGSARERQRPRRETTESTRKRALLEERQFHFAMYLQSERETEMNREETGDQWIRICRVLVFENKEEEVVNDDEEGAGSKCVVVVEVLVYDTYYLVVDLN